MNPHPSNKSTTLRSINPSEFKSKSPLLSEINRAVDLLKKPGGIVCFKLDHRYVLGACAFDDQGIQRILDIKKRKHISINIHPWEYSKNHIF